MKTRLLKRVLSPFLIAALVAGGVLAGVPGKADAAKKTIYNVEILNTDTLWEVKNPTENNESPCVFLASVNNGAPEPATVVANEGITFQMVVGTKAKTERVKIGKKRVKATYYKVTIPRRSFKAPIARYQTISGDEVYDVEVTIKMRGNAKGKLYISNGDVDVSQVQKRKKPKTRIGDGTVDPAGSLLIPIKTVTTIVDEATSKKLLKEKSKTIWTTGTSSIVVKGSKSGLEGMAFPDDDPTGLLTKPLVGVPLYLDAGIGKLVSTQASMNLKSPLGLIDNLRGQIWVMKIIRASESSDSDFNPAYSALAGIIPPAPPSPLYTVELSKPMVVPQGDGEMFTVTLTSRATEDLTGDLTIEGIPYGYYIGPDALSQQWVPIDPDLVTPGVQTISIITFADITVHPGGSISLPFFPSIRALAAAMGGPGYEKYMPNVVVMLLQAQFVLP